jgi:Domain of unknown function (DUF4381)
MHPTLFHLAQATAAGVPEGIYDIIVPEAERPLWPLFVYLAIALLLIAGLVWLVLFLLRNREPRLVPGSPAARAQRELESIERRRDELAPNAFALAVSETLKNYLAERHRDRVRYETTEEFLARLAREGSSLPPAAQQELQEFLTSAEEVKFGHRADAAAWCQPLLKRARQLISLCEAVSVSEGSKKR